MMVPADNVMALLDSWNRGDSAALDLLMETVHAELRRIAGGLFRAERPGHTLQPTAIVNEVYLKLSRQRQVSWANRAEFFAVAARLMRRVLVDHARRRNTAKRGGNVALVALDETLGFPTGLTPDVLTLDGALLDLERRSTRQSRIVELRVLVGLTLEEIASVEGISRSTVLREWRAARLFVLSQLQPA